MFVISRPGKHRRIWWNEKFRFPLSPRECRELAKVTLKIMERDKFAEDTLVGEIRYVLLREKNSIHRARSDDLVHCIAGCMWARSSGRAARGNSCR